MDRPWEKATGFRTFWIEKPWLLVGSYPNNKMKGKGEGVLKAILQDDARLFIDLTEPGELNRDGIPLVEYETTGRKVASSLGVDVDFARVPFSDGSIPTREDMASVLALLDAAEKDKRGVYLHCQGGRGRAGTVLGAWFVARRGMDARKVDGFFKASQNFGESKGRWNYPDYGGPVLENEEQRDFVRRFKA
jgi:hypothetical protein